jgi:hypothetical protein
MLLSLNGVAQYFEFGVNGGIVASRYTLSENFLGNSTWLRQGRIDYAPRFGIQIGLKGTPDKYKYKTVESKLKGGLMAELSTCRCGGKTELVSRLANGAFEVAELDYVTWQTDFNLLFRAKFNKTEFIFGPSISYHSYRGVSNSQKDPDEYQYTQGQIAQYYAGLELGLGYRIDRLLISSRYHTNLTEFGEESNTVPVRYNNHQARLVFSYFLYENRIRSFYKGLYF